MNRYVYMTTNDTPDSTKLVCISAAEDEVLPRHQKMVDFAEINNWHFVVRWREKLSAPTEAERHDVLHAFLSGEGSRPTAIMTRSVSGRFGVDVFAILEYPL